MSQTRVPDNSARPLNVIIIGAGISGLTLGIVLRSNGHHVQIYEQSQFARELGAAIHVAPNAYGLMKRMGLDLPATGANEVEWIHEFTPAAKLTRELPVGRFNKIWQHKWMMAHRVRVHDALKEKAVTPDGISRPCELFLSSSVIDVDPETATITLKDGTKITGDVVIGGDGVHSKARRKVPGGEDAQTFSSGKSAFRFMIKRQDALDDPATQDICKKRGAFTVAVGVDRRIIMYDTVNNTLLNFVCIHPDSESEAGEDWGSGTSKSALLYVYRDWSPAFQALLNKADPASLRLWKLLDMKNLPVWHHSRLALIGDAAHPFLPHQGQGAAIAMEDAVALGTVLERGSRPEEIPARLKLYNDIRYERACKVQAFTRLAGLDVQDGKLDTAEFSSYNFAHDEFDNSTQKLREWKWAQQPKAIFRMPVAFGPDQSLVPSITPPGSSPSFYTTSVHFRTSRTVLSGLFPPKTSGISFDTPGTLSNCSWIHTRYNNVPWLQGGGYDVLGLYIHNVAHKGPSRGSLVTVVFENSAHTVVRDREIYGLPAVYSEIRARHNADSVQVTASFGGHSWLKLTVEDFKSEDIQGALSSKAALLPGDDADTVLFSWRSVPMFSAENETDEPAELEAFTVKLSFNDDGNIQHQKSLKYSKATIRFERQDQNLPSVFSPVVERLAEMPIYEILGAQVISGSGKPALKQAYRV